MDIFEFLFEFMGFPVTDQSIWFYFVISAILVLLMLDGLLSFLFGGISSITTRGKK